MSENVSFDDSVWGSPAPGPHSWGAKQTAVAVGIAAVIAALGGAAIYAATGESSPRMTGPAHLALGPPGGDGGPMLGAGPMSAGGGPTGNSGGPMTPMGPPLHGQFVVSDPSGFTTVLTQTGTVTAASPTSITVRSEDNFTLTYATAGAPGTSTVVVDDVVSLRARQRGDAVPTVTEIADPHAGR